MLTAEKLKEVLARFPEAQSVKVAGEREVVATLVSGSFANRDEAERQEDVWKFLQARFPDEDLQSIEFVFTNAPGEN